MPPCSPSIAPSTSSEDIASLCSSPSSMMGGPSTSCATFSQSVTDPIKPTLLAYPPLVAPASSLVIEDAGQGANEVSNARFERGAVVVPSTLRVASESTADFGELGLISRRKNVPIMSTLDDTRSGWPRRASTTHLPEKKSKNEKRLRFDTNNIKYIDDIPSRPLSSKAGNEQDDVPSSPSGFLDSSKHLLSPKSEPVTTCSTYSSTWWTREELQTFKESAKKTSRKVRRRSAFTTCLDVAYQTAASPSTPLLPSAPSPCSTASESSSNEEEANIDQQPPTTTAELRGPLQRGLAKWSAHGHSCGGLERRSSQYQFETRGRDIVSARQAVLEEQEAARALGSSPKRRKVSLDHRDASREDAVTDTSVSLAESIQRVSLEQTERARLFARMMGQADAAAVGRK